MADKPKLPPKFLWQKLGYPTPESAQQAGIDPAFKTYEWLHFAAELVGKHKIPWPYDGR